MSDEKQTAPFTRIYADIPPDVAAGAAVAAATLRMSKKDFYAQAIREKVESVTGSSQTTKPKRKGSKNG